MRLTTPPHGPGCHPAVTQRGQGQKAKMRLQDLIRKVLTLYIILFGVTLISEKDDPQNDPAVCADRPSNRQLGKKHLMD